MFDVMLGPEQSKKGSGARGEPTKQSKKIMMIR
jgi:hypothetical protein